MIITYFCKLGPCNWVTVLHYNMIWCHCVSALHSQWWNNREICNECNKKSYDKITRW